MAALKRSDAALVGTMRSLTAFIRTTSFDAARSSRDLGFALLYLNSPPGTATMRDLAITSASLLSLSVGKIQRITVPIPPLAEQHRIVAKVDELIAVCDELETALDAAQH